MLKKFIEFINEVKLSKLDFFKSEVISSEFTSSIEIELETIDTEGTDDPYEDEEDIDNIINTIRNYVIKETSRDDKFKMTKKLLRFMDGILDDVKDNYDDYDYVLDDLLDEKSYDDINEKTIIKLINPLAIIYFFSDNLVYLKNNIKSKLPNFYEKWNNHIKFEIDESLDRGIEISNKKYFNDLSTLFNFIDDFYSDYESQDYWKFSERTGIHINLGIKGDKKYNPIKGLLMLDDMGDSPFVFKNMEWRQNLKFTGSLKSELSKDTTLLKHCLSLLRNNKIEEVENIINPELDKILRKKSKSIGGKFVVGYKKFGVNLIPLEKYNYVEFRYPGGNIDKKTLIDKVLYFAYITYMMVDREMDKNKYIKKLYTFIDKNINKDAI